LASQVLGGLMDVARMEIRRQRFKAFDEAVPSGESISPMHVILHSDADVLNADVKETIEKFVMADLYKMDPAKGVKEALEAEDGNTRRYMASVAFGLHRGFSHVHVDQLATYMRVLALELQPWAIKML